MKGDLRKDYTVKNYQNGNELRKYMAGDISNSLNKTCEVAYPIYRYTDMMLLQAEARAHQGKWGEALDLVKTVRDRAGLNTLTENDFASEDEVVNYILRERQVELAGEGRRWFEGSNLALRSHHMRHIVGICSFLECASYSSRSQGIILST